MSSSGTRADEFSKGPSSRPGISSFAFAMNLIAGARCQVGHQPACSEDLGRCHPSPQSLAPWIATSAASSARRSLSFRAWMVSLNRIRSRARRSLLHRRSRPGADPANAQARQRLRISEASTALRLALPLGDASGLEGSVPEGAGSAIARRTDPVMFLWARQLLPAAAVKRMDMGK